MLNFIQTYRLIREHDKISNQRHPLFEQNKFTKFFVYMFIGFWAIYLMFFGFVIGQIDNLNYEIFDILDGYMIFFLIVDFVLRLTFQEIPAQRAKPYKFLPIKQHYVIDSFLIKSIINPFNLFWFFFWIPFSLFTTFRFYGLPGFIFYNLGWVLLYIINNLWFMFWRTAARNNAVIYIIPFCIYGIAAYVGYFADFSNKFLFNLQIQLFRSLCHIDIGTLIILLMIICCLFIINRHYQYNCVYDELSNKDKLKHYNSTEFTWLNRFGYIGEYLKLEIKSTKRNKTVRKSFVSGLLCVIVFSFLFAFTDIYDNSIFMEIFICIYCFSCMGTITLTNILCAEGNYIDFLFSRKESIYYLLKSKYYYNCILLLLPFMFALLPVFKGKFLFIEILGCLFFVAGCVFPFLFQQAVYNKHTIPLNVQIIKQSSNSKVQIITSLLALFTPMIIMNILYVVFDSRITTSITMLTMGLIGTLSNSIWIRNIYNRLLKRRYINMESFRSTRQ